MKNMKILLAIILLSGIGGCKKLKSTIESTFGQRETPPDSGLPSDSSSGSSDTMDPEERSDNAMIRKISAYVECLNRHSKNVHDSRDRYFSWCSKCDGVKTPTEKQNHIVWGVFAINDPTECAAGIAKAKTLSPSVPDLEKAGDAYVAAMKELYPITKEANHYYDQKDYLEDKGQKARQFHAVLVAGFDHFDEALDALDLSLTTIQDKLDAHQIARYKKNGDTPRYLIHLILQQSKQVLKASEQKDPKHIDLPAYSKLIADFEPTVLALDDYVDVVKHPDHKEKVKEISGAEPIARSSKEFLGIAKDLSRKLHGEKAVWQSFPDLRQSLLSDYNSLIDVYNSNSNSM